MKKQMWSSLSCIVIYICMTIVLTFNSKDTDLNLDDPPLPRISKRSDNVTLRDRVAIRRHERTQSRLSRKLICYDMLGCFNAARRHSPLKKSPDSPEVVDTKFWLYTRANDTVPQEIQYGDDLESVLDSYFRPDLCVRMIIHGFKGSGWDKGAIAAVQALLKLENCNVIVVDWEKGAANSYAQAVANTELVGRQIGLLLLDLLSINTSPEKMHLIGFSIGAHAAACAGHIVKTQGSLIGRITGLDPASPIYKNQLLLDSTRKLDSSDASFVDVIHTDGSAIWTDGFGLLQPLGHVDFFPNGGREQPGCNDGRVSVVISHFEGSINSSVVCSHIRAWQLFLESLTEDPAGCKFTAYPCQQGLPTFQQGNCFPTRDYCSRQDLASNETCAVMGLEAEQSKGRGALYLVTRDSSPFCGEQLRATVSVSEKTQRTQGILYLQLKHGNSATNFRINCELMDVLQGGKLMWGLAAALYGTISPTATPTMKAVLSYQSLAFQTISPEGEQDENPSSPQVYLDKVSITDQQGNSWHFCGKDTLLEDKNMISLEQMTIKLTLTSCTA